MRYEALTVLIPSHSLEDLPADLPEQQAEGLLNAFAVAWHPMLLDAAGGIPSWHRADEPPQELKDRLFIIPTASQDWLPCQWLDHAREQGAVLVTGVNERTALIEAVLDPLGVAASNTEMAGDFLALGHCYLQLEMLTRQMRYFNELDQRRLQSESVSAARAALAGDHKAAESHLRACFEVLLEGRERFYPVDCYLADLCLLTPDMAQEEWSALVQSDRTVNYLVTGQDLQAIAEQHPEELAALRARWRDGQQEVLGGEWSEIPSALLPLESILPSFRRGLSAIEKLCGRRPTVWGLRKYGVGVQVPQLLDKLGYEAALHFVIDDGLYPDEEQGKHRWEGCDGSVIDAVSRIPLAADSSSAMLRFPHRMAESMDYDHAALLVVARWPKLQTPWLEDLHRIEKYTPVLGRFVTFSDFFRTTDTPGRLSRHKAGDYLSPHLVAAVAREEADPISRYSDHWERHHRIESVLWTAGMADLLTGTSIDAKRFTQRESLVDCDLNAAAPARCDERERALNLEEDEAAERLARTLVGGRGRTPGYLIANSCSYARRVVVACPEGAPPVQSAAALVAQHRDHGQRTLIVDLPPSGFVWLPAGEDVVPEAKSARIPLAEHGILRNEQFEVRLSEVTGGIAQVRTYRRSPNRLSQQLAFRFPRELTVAISEGDDSSQERTWYSDMRVTESRIVADGPLGGEIESKGVLLDPTNGAVLATFTQNIRVWRGLPVIEVETELEPERMPQGDPWSNFYAVRWAWSDSTAALTCSVHEGAQPVTADRFEAPHFVEIANDEEQRTTIHWLGLPFHRKTGPRMLDTLLITAGETRRRFRFVISIDDCYPMERSRGLGHRAEPVFVADGPDQPMSGWFFHVDARNVQITRLMPLGPLGAASDSDRSDAGAPEVVEVAADHQALRLTELGVKLRLRETEGRACSVKLRSFQQPTSARQCDFLDKPVTDLAIDGDAVLVSLTPYEICDVQLHFS